MNSDTAQEGVKKDELSRERSRVKDLPVGILRLDFGKPRGASTESKHLSQIEPTSPQPSVDRLSVTFAEDSLKSDASIKCNFFAPSTATPIMEKARFSPRGTVTDEENSEDEDYSASANAIMLRRASTKKTSKRRRTSSPFSPDILPGGENGLRRSSCYTTSSGDTAITVDESLAPEITQDQIFENIRLHKEVLSDVKMQPWPMRKKLRLVVQAKTYIKKHEGALQKRLAQSHSTKDMLARFNIYLIKRWQHLKRETANFANWVIPWELRIKEIESHFGSVVASYFVFLRWLFWVNLVTSIILIAFVTVPEFLAADHKDAEDRKTVLKEERYNATNFLTLWNFEGVFKYSPLFYGWYTDRDTDDRGYRRPLAYFMTGLAVYVYSFVATLRKMAENSRTSKLLEKDDEYTFSWKLFTGWDYMIGNAETAHNRIASIIMGFKEALLEEAEKKREDKNWKIITIRIFVNITVLVLLLTSAYAVVEVVRRSTEPEAKSSVWRMNETTVVMNLISLCFPLAFEILGICERYHPRKQLRIQLARIMALNLLNLYALIIAHFDEISKMQVSLEDFKNRTLALSSLNTKVSELAPNLSSVILCNESAPTIQADGLISALALSAPTLLSLIGGDLNTTAGYDGGGNSTWMELENYTAITESEGDALDFEEAIHSFLDKIENDVTTLYATDLQNATGEFELSSTAGDVLTREDLQSNVTLSFEVSTTTSDYVSTPPLQNNVTLSFGVSKTTSDYFSTPPETTVHEDNLGMFSADQFTTEPVTTLPKNCVSFTSNDSSVLDSFSLDEASITRMDYKSRSKLRSLCWETVFGQELLKLTVMDLIMTIVSTLGMDFFRGVFIRVMNNCWCWDLEKTFPQYGDFKVAENILHLVNNQGMVWMGMFFSPGLIVLNVFKLYILVYFRSWVVMTCNVPHKIVFRASRSNNFYFGLLLLMLFLCVLPVGYAIVRVRPSWHCGPFSQYQLIFHIFTKSLKRALPKSLHKVLDYIASPGIIIPLLVLLILIIYYLISLTNALREANSDLKVQLRRERTEERRKMFQIADRRRRVGSEGSAEIGQTPLTKWKKLLHNLPGGKSFDDTPRQESVELAKQRVDLTKPDTNKSKDFFSKFIKRALRKSSVTSNEDEGTDTEQPDSLPEDVSSAKEPRRSFSVRSSSFKRTVEVAMRLQKDEGHLSIDSNGPARAHGGFRRSSPSRSSSSKEVVQVRQDSVASTWSDNIPVITISKTESAECILEQSAKPKMAKKVDDEELLRDVESQVVEKSGDEDGKSRGKRVLTKQNVTEDESSEKSPTVIENKPEEKRESEGRN